MSAVDDVYTYLGPSPGQGFFGGATGWDGFRRRFADAPAKDQSVVVAEDGGRSPEIKATSGLSGAGTALQDIGVMVTVRAGAWDGDASKAKAIAILAQLHGQRNVQLVSGGVVYHRVRAMTPEPVFAGFDDTGRPRHTIAFRLLTAVA